MYASKSDEEPQQYVYRGVRAAWVLWIASAVNLVRTVNLGC